MKRTILRTAICTAFALFASLSLYAGDAAVFQDIGFSDDGTTYIFGQYGKTDKNYEAWAEIYTVDVAKNDYVKGEVFTTEPSAETVNVTSTLPFAVKTLLLTPLIMPSFPERLFIDSLNASITTVITETPLSL